MSQRDATDAFDPEARMSIGALSRATGIPVETLRTWERRYGFPVPERKVSGHRVYPAALVPRLQRIALVLARGHRAAEVLPANEHELAVLLAMTAAGPSAGMAPAPGAPPPAPRDAAPLDAGPLDPSPLLVHVERYEGEPLVRKLFADWAMLGPLQFLTARVAPLVRAVGEGWMQRRLSVRHEHFFSDRLADVLRTLRLPLAERATGALIPLATLPGETHGLGIQIAGLLLASVGCRPLLVGTDVPLDDLVDLLSETQARWLGLSISAGAPGPRTRADLRTLARALPSGARLLLGGDGARDLPPCGALVITDLAQLDRWARSLTSSSAS